MTEALTSKMCSHSIGQRLSRKLALFTMLVLGVLFMSTWWSISTMIIERNQDDLELRSKLIAELAQVTLRNGSEAAVLARLQQDAAMRAKTRLQVWRANGELLYADADAGVHAMSRHHRSSDMEIPGINGQPALRLRYSVDFAKDAEMGNRWAWVLLGLTLLAGVMVAYGVRWHVRRQLRPLRDLAAQTLAISPSDLSQRLTLADPAEELLPWVTQFNALLDRVQSAYAQLEGFNADVAHELRTPLANVMGQTEVALARERDSASLRDTLASNLEEMQRLAGMVNDMLFLSQADRGAVARRGEPVSLAALAHQVLEFHEGALEEAQLQLRVQGDATLPVDEPLVKRALSNLLGNATRFARPGSTVVVDIKSQSTQEPGVQVLVINEGAAIADQALPRLFDRFFRVDTSRCCDGQTQHHGLGLAIVAAIARMHAGRTVAESQKGVTRLGFTLG
jgi:two-component system, OmpR family, heavy metal sensor histidine kinase CusS